MSGRIPLARTPTWLAFETALVENCGFIMLPHGQFTLVDEEDLPSLDGFSWHGIRSNAYVAAWINGDHVYLHRWLVKPGAELEVDHKNQNKRDNRKVNLRICDHVQNGANKAKLTNGKSSRFKGVAKKYHRWTARGKVNGKRIWIGQFATEQEAAQAYDRFAFQTYGEFAHLNFPDLLLRGEFKP